MQKVRDVMLTVMALLVSIVCAGLIYFALAAGSALSEIGTPQSPVSTADLLPDDPPECVGEEPIPGNC